MTPEPAVWFPAVHAGSGADVFTMQLVEVLRRRGLQAEITWLPHRAEYAPWSVAPIAPPGWANIVHVNTWLHRRFLPTRLPIVATQHLCVHDPALNPYKRHLQRQYHRLWVYRLERHLLRQARRVVAVSHYTAARTRETFDITLPAVIHNGIDVDGVFQPGPAREPKRPFRLLYAGNWSVRKGVDLLAPIMRELGPGFELLYTADRAGAVALGELPPNARALGRVTSPAAMATVYRDADALLFPTRLEGLPLVPLEAMACGLPVIASCGSSLPELIENGYSGLLCAQDDVAGFAAAARRLATDSGLWVRMGQAARTRAQVDFSLESTVEGYIAVYRELLDQGADQP